MKRSGKLSYLRLKIDTAKKCSSGADPEIFAGEVSVQDTVYYFCKRFCTIFTFSLIALGVTCQHVLF